jgi:hypothetical protein
MHCSAVQAITRSIRAEVIVFASHLLRVVDKMSKPLDSP